MFSPDCSTESPAKVIHNSPFPCRYRNYGRWSTYTIRPSSRISFTARNSCVGCHHSVVWHSEHLLVKSRKRNLCSKEGKHPKKVIFFVSTLFTLLIHLPTALLSIQQHHCFRRSRHWLEEQKELRQYELSRVQNRNAPKSYKNGDTAARGRSRRASTAMLESPCRWCWYHQSFLLQRDPRGSKMVLVGKAISADFPRVPQGWTACVPQLALSMSTDSPAQPG